MGKPGVWALLNWGSAPAQSTEGKVLRAGEFSIQKGPPSEGWQSHKNTKLAVIVEPDIKPSS
eukprot:gene4085-19657_t